MPCTQQAADHHQCLRQLPTVLAASDLLPDAQTAAAGAAALLLPHRYQPHDNTIGRAACACCLNQKCACCTAALSNTPTLKMQMASVCFYQGPSPRHHSAPACGVSHHPGWSQPPAISSRALCVSDNHTTSAARDSTLMPDEKGRSCGKPAAFEGTMCNYPG